SNFLRKFWRLFVHDGKFEVTDEAPTKEELKALHKAIKKVTDDMERFSFNTSVSTFMICVNELTDLKCRKRSILEPLTVLISPFAPHIAEELWSRMGNNSSITTATYPAYDERHVIEDDFEYPISVNGKTRFKITLPKAMSVAEVESAVLVSAEMAKWLTGTPPKKVIVVPGRIVNVVL
ncbi:MAG: class I tRNA ligase family protein, partial [Bacteroidota bacterium]